MTYFCTYAIHKVLWQGLIFHAFNAVFPRSSCTFSTLPTMFFHTFPVHFPHFHRCFSTHSPHIFHAFSVVYSTHSPHITILCSIVPSLFFSARSRLIVYTSCVVAHTSKTAAIWVWVFFLCLCACAAAGYRSCRPASKNFFVQAMCHAMRLCQHQFISHYWFTEWDIARF